MPEIRFLSSELRRAANPGTLGLQIDTEANFWGLHRIQANDSDPVE